MTVQISRDVGITPCITTSHFTTLVRVVLIGYFPAMLAVGFSFWRRSRLVAGFTAVEGCLSGWLTGLSILGTYISNISFLALPARAFTSNGRSLSSACRCRSRRGSPKPAKIPGSAGSP